VAGASMLVIHGGNITYFRAKEKEKKEKGRRV
jgi:hypothetical protein